jgi:hypothetical protein
MPFSVCCAEEIEGVLPGRHAGALAALPQTRPTPLLGAPDQIGPQGIAFYIAADCEKKVNPPELERT